MKIIVAASARSIVRAAASALALLFAAMPARAQVAELDFTGVLTDVRLVPSAAVGDVVTGSFFLYAGGAAVTSTNGTTFAIAAHDSAAPAPLLSRGTLLLADGTLLTTDVDAGQHTEVDLYRQDHGNPHGSFNGYTLSTYETTSGGLSSSSLEVFVGDFLDASSSIFSTPPGDLSILQPVDWLAPGAVNGGTFTLTGGDHPSLEFTLTEARFVVATPVPEPSMNALLLAGLAATAWTMRRRRPRCARAQRGGRFGDSCSALPLNQAPACTAPSTMAP